MGCPLTPTPVTQRCQAEGRLCRGEDRLCPDAGTVQHCPDPERLCQTANGVAQPCHFEIKMRPGIYLGSGIKTIRESLHDDSHAVRLCPGNSKSSTVVSTVSRLQEVQAPKSTGSKKVARWSPTVRLCPGNSKSSTVVPTVNSTEKSTGCKRWRPPFHFEAFYFLSRFGASSGPNKRPWLAPKRLRLIKDESTLSECKK